MARQEQGGGYFCLLCGFVFSVTWLIILRYAAGFMAWITILLVNLLLLAITLYCFSMAGLLGDSSVAQVGGRGPNRASGGS